MRQLAIAALILSISATTRAQSPNSGPTDLPSFGLVGINPMTQYLRLNVTNVKVPGLQFLDPPGTFVVAPCTVEMMFSDSQGNTLKRSSALIAPGQSTYLDITAADLPGAANGLLGNRVELLPAVQRSAGCIAMPSVEIISREGGLTEGYILRHGANGNGFLPAWGLVGMAPERQFIRFNVSNQPLSRALGFGNCTVMLSYFDAAGNQLKTVETPLPVGMSTQLDLTRSDLQRGVGRTEALPTLVASGKCALNSSVEVVAIGTEHTDAYAEDAMLSLGGR